MDPQNKPPPPPGSPLDPDDFIEKGDWGEVRYARRANGVMEAKQWLSQADLGVQAKFDQLFRRIASAGKISNKEHFRNLDDGIWEFKRDGDRILCFQDKRKWLLTHHYPKGGRAKCPPSEIQHAKDIRTEYFERIKKQTPAEKSNG